MKYLLALGLLGMASANTYKLVSSGDLVFSDSGHNHYLYDSLNDPEIRLFQNVAYTFKRDTGGHPLRVIKESDCTNCDVDVTDGDGMHWIGLTAPASSLSGWDADVGGNSEKSFTFTEPGTYYYLCSSHANMMGKIIVLSDHAYCSGTSSGPSCKMMNDYIANDLVDEEWVNVDSTYDACGDWGCDVDICGGVTSAQLLNLKTDIQNVCGGGSSGSGDTSSGSGLYDCHQHDSSPSSTDCPTSNGCQWQDTDSTCHCTDGTKCQTNSHGGSTHTGGPSSDPLAGYTPTKTNAEINALNLAELFSVGSVHTKTSGGNSEVKYYKVVNQNAGTAQISYCTQSIKEHTDSHGNKYNSSGWRTATYLGVPCDAGELYKQTVCDEDGSCVEASGWDLSQLWLMEDEANYIIGQEGSETPSCDDPKALNNGAQAACEFFKDLTYDQKKAKLANVDKRQKKADHEYWDVNDLVGWLTARSAARVAAKEARRAQIKEGITDDNWKDMIVTDEGDFEGYTDEVLAKRGGRPIHYRFVPKGDTGEQSIEISPGGAINAASTAPLESFDLDLDTCLTITVTDLGNIRVCKDNIGALTVACNGGAPEGKNAGQAVQCLGYEWDVGSLTWADGSCVANAIVDTNTGVCTCDTGYVASDTDGDSDVDTCLADTDGDGVADVDEVVGCTDPTRCNYNAAATDSGTCLRALDGVCETCSGATDGTGTIVDNDLDNDNVCDADEVEGCQDPTRCNYNAAATDSGTCLRALDGVCETCSGATDGTGTIVDNDLDNDNVCNSVDAFPNDATETVDTDGDGIGDNTDTDDDGDGVPDAEDSKPLNKFLCKDSDNDGCDDCSSGTFDPNSDGLDTDGDGQCDGSDTDRDGDGITDANEAIDGTLPLDADSYDRCRKATQDEDSKEYINNQCCNC